MTSSLAKSKQIISAHF